MSQKISAALVKELRERTDASIMDCKKVLVEANGSIEEAVELLQRKSGAKAAKKSSRVAAEGKIVIDVEQSGKRAVMVEVNCETDFVGRDENFLAFCKQVSQTALTTTSESVEELMKLECEGETLEAIRLALVSKIGENIQVRRLKQLQVEEGQIGAYIHGGRIGVLTHLTGSAEESVAKDVAMHVAAINPEFIDPSQVPAENLAKQKEIFMEQVQDSGKPAEIQEKIVGGRLNKWLEEICLVKQPFVKDPDQKVEQLLESHKTSIADVVRFETGEGIQKEEVNFAEEVMAQVRGG